MKSESYSHMATSIHYLIIETLYVPISLAGDADYSSPSAMIYQIWHLLFAIFQSGILCLMDMDLLTKMFKRDLHPVKQLIHAAQKIKF